MCLSPSECNSNRDSVLSYTSVRSNSSYLGSDEMGSGEISKRHTSLQHTPSQTSRLSHRRCVTVLFFTFVCVCRWRASLWHEDSCRQARQTPRMSGAPIQPGRVSSAPLTDLSAFFLFAFYFLFILLSLFLPLMNSLFNYVVQSIYLHPFHPRTLMHTAYRAS